MNAEEFKRLTRVQQVEKCGSCHKAVYENEKKGPHANAYIKLLDHIQFINSENYGDTEYTSLVNAVKLNCTRCHAPENLYETIYKDYSVRADSLINHLVSNGPIMPDWRKDSTSLTTGVDCMSCHFDGQRVVTQKSFSGPQTDSCPSFCSPVASNLFSSNANCSSCHYEAVSGMYHLPGLDKTITEGCSSSCHQEFKNSKATHYYWWQHDPADKKRPEILGGIFKGLNVSFEKKSSTLWVNWKNKVLPHTMNECREMTALVQIRGGNDRLLTSETIRLNRKKFHDKAILSSCFGNKKVPGYEGAEFDKDSKSITTEIQIPLTKENELKISIIGGHKAQYWFPDSLIDWVYGKDTVINLK